MFKFLLCLLIFHSLFLPNETNDEKIEIPSSILKFHDADELKIVLKDFNYISQIHNSTLGRDNDPKLIEQVSKTGLFFRKIGWKMLMAPGLRFWTRILYPESTISHFDVTNAVALTIDDGFCGLDNPDGCMLNEVRKLLKSYNANATFFVTGTHCFNTKLDEVNQLIEDGNEIANHNMMDWKYDKYSNEEFKLDLLLSKKILTTYNQSYSKWYRAPFGLLSRNMENIIADQQMKHVLPDAFAHDTYIPDPEWIATHILGIVKSGSIILIHMPERGVREWNYKALELILIGLVDRGFKILNLSEIESMQKTISLKHY